MIITGKLLFWSFPVLFLAYTNQIGYVISFWEEAFPFWVKGKYLWALRFFWEIGILSPACREASIETYVS